LVGFAAVKLGSIIVFDILLGFTPLSPPQVLRDVLVAGGYMGVGLWQLSRSGVTLSGIVTTSAVMTAIIVFSLQDSLSNILGGLVLQIDESFAVGDWVKIEPAVGRVKEITWRHIAIETRNWDTVIIPNSQLMKSRWSSWDSAPGSRPSSAAGFISTWISVCRRSKSSER